MHFRDVIDDVWQAGFALLTLSPIFTRLQTGINNVFHSKLQTFRHTTVLNLPEFLHHFTSSQLLCISSCWHRKTHLSRLFTFIADELRVVIIPTGFCKLQQVIIGNDIVHFLPFPFK